MSILPNLFSDPVLRTRQDQLNAQWNSLRASYTLCQNTPDASFAEWATDYAAWQEFYNSESDWSTNSFNATNEWQAKAADWASKFASWGCTGNDPDYEAGVPSGIPGVKPPPADQQSLIDKAGQIVSDDVGGVTSTIKTIGWIAVGVLVLIIVGLIYLIPRTKVSTPSGGIG